LTFIADSVVEEKRKVSCSTDVSTAKGSRGAQEGEETQHNQWHSQVRKSAIFLPFFEIELPSFGSGLHLCSDFCASFP